MNAIGDLEPNLDAIENLFAAIALHLAGDRSRLALWLLQPFDLGPLEVQTIGANSPFGSSNSVLAGKGLLLKLDSSTVDRVIEELTTNGRLSFEVLHLEIEAQNAVQFAAFDHFGYVTFGNAVSLDWLADLQQQGVIERYCLFSDAP